MSVSPHRHRYTQKDIANAQHLRKEASPAEKKLWPLLRENAKSHDLHFRRQCPIHPYIADFACLKLRLLIELDGESHQSRQTYDKQRDIYLAENDYVVLRFANQDVTQNTEGVVETILKQALQLKDRPCV